MSSWHPVLILFVAATALSGCLAGEKAGDDAQEPGPSGGSAPGPSTGPSQSAADNAPPLVRLTSDIKNGRIPFNVTFELVGSDADRDPLQWTFDADGDAQNEIDGTGLPAQYTHTYNETGVFVAKLTVNDGTTSREAIVNITAFAEVGTDLPPPITFSGQITGVYAPGAGQYLPEIIEHTFEYETIVNLMNAVMEFQAPALDLDMALFDPQGNRVSRSADYNDPTGTLYSPGEEMNLDNPEHLSKLGTWTLKVYAYASVQGAYTVTITFS